MRNEQTRWLLNLVLVLVAILLITLIFCQIIEKPTSPIPEPQIAIEGIEIKEETPHYTSPVFSIDVYEGMWGRPSAFIEIVNTDISEMIQDNRLKLIINGQIYWIRLEK